MSEEKNNLILDYYLVGSESIYGLKTKDTDPPQKGKAHSVLLPTHAPHTRYYFAQQYQKELLIELSKRVSGGATIQGNTGQKLLHKINQCERIIQYYATNKGAWGSEEVSKTEKK